MTINNPPDFTHIIATDGTRIRPTITALEVGKNKLVWGIPDELTPSIVAIGSGIKELQWNISPRITQIVKNIGAWNMDTTASKVINSVIPEAIFPENIVGIFVTIRDDGGTQSWSLQLGDAGTGILNGVIGTYDASANTLTLFRVAGGGFDAGDFTTAANRGYVTILYQNYD